MRMISALSGRLRYSVWFANLNVLIGQIMGEWSFGQLMGQKGKVVHWPARLFETVELQLIGHVDREGCVRSGKDVCQRRSALTL
jgi:hypothetical protein